MTEPKAGLTMTHEGGDRYQATMSNGTRFWLHQEDWSVKTDYYLETLVFRLPELIGQMRALGNPLGRVLEMGIARGAISIGIALLTDAATEIVGIDIEEKARLLVAENAAANGVGERITVRIGDLFQPVGPGEMFDLIVAEMPFIPVDPVLQERYVAEGHGSEILNVSGGADGRMFIDAVIASGAGCLRAGGSMLLVQPSFIGIGSTLDLMAAHDIDGAVAVSRPWRLEDTRFTLRSQPYIESLYPDAFPTDSEGRPAFHVTIILGTRR